MKLRSGEPTPDAPCEAQEIQNRRKSYSLSNAERSKSLPDGISEKHFGSRHGQWLGSLPLVLLGVILVAALSGAFGGGADEPLRAKGPDAELAVDMPRILRSGMYFEMQIEVRADRNLTDAVIGIHPGLWRDITINTTIPQAGDERYERGMLRMRYGALGAGDHLILKVDGQINPDLLVGTRGSVALFDGDKRLAEVPVTVTVLP